MAQEPHTKPKSEYGKRLRDLRVGRGLTQIDLADKVHVSYGTIGNIEKGRTFPQPLIRHRIANFFGTDELLSSPKKTGPASTDKLSSLRTEIENFDVIRPAPDVSIFVNPDLPLEQKKIIQEVGMELRRRLLEKRRG